MTVNAKMLTSIKYYVKLQQYFNNNSVWYLHVAII